MNSARGGRSSAPARRGDDPYQAFSSTMDNVQTLSDVPAEELVKAANDIGHSLKTVGVRAAQLRHILDEVNRIRMEARRPGVEFRKNVLPRVVLLKPRFAYLAGRERDLKGLYHVLSEMIDRVHDRDDFETLAEFVQGVVAYHRFYGGSDR